MANTTVEAQLPPGLTLTLELYPDGSDTIANGAGDTLTEATNRHGLYTATVTEALSGYYFAVIVDGSDVLIATGWVKLADDTSTYKLGDRTVAIEGTANQLDDLNDISAADVNAQCDTAISDAALATAASVAALNDLSAADVNAQCDTAISDAALATAASVAAVGAAVGALNDLSAADVNAACDTAIADAALATGTAQGGTSTTIQLAASETFGDDILNGNIVKITGGTGAGQSRRITDYVGSTDTATVHEAWATTPDNTSTYEVVEGSHVTGISQAEVNQACDDAISDAALATSAALDTVDSNVDAILADTNELQTDWTDGGRLDLLLDALITEIDTATAEPGQGAPAATLKRGAKLDYLYKWARNKVEQTSTERKHYADDGTTVDQKSTVSDDGSTFIRGEMATGA